jgi:polyferredoxin
MKKYIRPIFILLLFIGIGVSLSYSSGNNFYIFNFTYIGGFVSLGMILFAKKWKYARLMVQFGVGLYMFGFLGILCRENMQMEGFWYYLFLGVFEGATIHYFVAKIGGPLIFGRGWCGYACWTAMVLDLLPYKKPENTRKNKLSYIRYIVFICSISFVGILFLLKVKNMDEIMFISFIVGNLLYYTVGIILAFKLKDNRAFCKYICPITVFLKPMSYFSIMRIKVDKNKCISCNKCKSVCPMDVDMLDEKRSRKNGTECIICEECIRVCPKNAIKL